MVLHNRELELAQLVTGYLRRGRSRKLAQKYMPRDLKELTRMQDRIGWRNFTEGKISKCFRLTQRGYLKASGALLTVDSWLKAFVRKLLAMTHSMWIVLVHL